MIVILKAAGSLALALLSACLLQFEARAKDDPDKIAAAVDRAFRPLLKEHDVAGIAVAVTIDGRQRFFNYGVAARDAKTPVTENTLFEIGSISKTFTATLALYAQASGALSLNDPPGKHMPQLRNSAIDAASLLNLGTYTAGGLPLQFPGSVTSNARMIDFFQQWKPSAAPGAVRRYSNPSIGLLGHITALAMRGDFAQLMDAQIFSKLGLRRTYIRVPKAEMTKYAWGYSRNNKPTRLSPAVFEAEAYGVKSSTADMIRYVEAQLRPQTQEPALRRAIEGTHVGYFRTGDMVQGLGWEQYPYPVTLEQLLTGNSEAIVMKPNPTTPIPQQAAPSEPAFFNKTGSTNGFGAYVAFVPARHIGLVMLANRNLPVPARITAAHAVLDQLSAAAP